jgi:hypothetical protein
MRPLNVRTRPYSNTPGAKRCSVKTSTAGNTNASATSPAATRRVRSAIRVGISGSYPT